MTDPAPATGTAPGTAPTPDGADRLVQRLVAALGAEAADGVVDASTRRRAEYTSDASNYRVVPQVVVFPRSTEDVEAVFAVCRELGVPFTSRGAGTSVAGNAVGTGVVLDFSRHLNRVLEVDAEGATALIEPGVVLDDLQREAAPHGLRFGPDPSTHARCTVGGMIGNDACGSHALAYGRTSHNVLALEVLDGHGRRFWTDDPPADLLGELEAVAGRHLATIRTGFGTFGRQVSGYALEHLLPETGGPRGTALARLLTGSEGTLATILRARVRLVRQSASTTFVVLGYRSMHEAADATPALLTHRPLAVEGIDRRLADAVVRRGGSVDGLPTGDGWLFVEMGGDTPEESLAAARAMVADSAALDSVVIPTAADARKLWRIREDGAGLAGRSPEGQPAWPGWEDAAVPPEKLGTYLREFDALMASHGVDGLAYGHFGDGCIHVRIDFPLYDGDGAQRTKAFLEDAARLVAAHGGSLSGEHGDGRARGALLPLMYDADSIAAFEEVKHAFDPADLLNPGVLVRPAPVDADLRVPAARPAHALGMPLKFAYSHDAGDLTRAVHRCVGVGKCRADSGGVMCPSFLATGDEKDSTRGRARLLQEMVNGTLVTDGWRAQEVHDVLDLCLSCKGCTADCPAGVDMPTYKAEFLDKHYAGRLRPMNHYLLGWLPRWSRLATLHRFETKLVNALTGVPALAALAKRVGGIAQERPLPRFAEQTFRAWFGRRPVRTGGQPVVLWVDSFTEHFSPEVGQAAVTLLEHLGFDVSVTTERVCCGLTWVSTGQLDGAKKQLRASLDALSVPGLPADAPVVGLEPSCTALLREDAAELLPDDPRAHALKTRVRTLAELITEQRPDWVPPRLDPDGDVRAVVQPHCHQHAVMGFAPDAALLAKAGVDAQVLSGCCGLAGNFGAEDGHYDVSVKVAEHALLPALRGIEQDPGAVVVADGYSCRTQSDNLAGVRPKHLAELLVEALQRQG
ncbi:FAD-binding oxidoreductase [Paenibacillus sp. TRM 82003]|uniref:FAD-binding and (Fe-S)-binding domain-containing protein n=1 Tax=Kineococcus sp. TRM81007 TaxID=2925831 RepID=UPI001F597E70|nr:FAD-binding and (Fe-S)-binding domain-containing protein [Kineococcus sp. TRM81007]MCI2237158.1 FAD-binding oxidoreductase [Kineococcus sp. TRM81007]MCI3925279.1 FAD-binding oxidoreductase [Paenibacillus sp. TRM 82003]